MVAIFTGAGTGFERGSGGVLGTQGLLGQAAHGRSGEQVMLNAANGNLFINQRDEFLLGRGPDAAIGRSYNSLGDLSDENGDNWRQSTDRRVYGLTGALNTFGSTVSRASGDGSITTYRFDGTAYVSSDGAGAFDRLAWSGAAWTSTDGATQAVETYGYSRSGAYFITEARDPSGNTITYAYVDGRLSDVTTANGDRVHYTWAGNNIEEFQTFFARDGVTRMATRTRYEYDSLGRLAKVAVDLSPDDNSTADGQRYVTQYSYHGSGKLVASLTQTDGTRVDFAYDSVNRVISVKQFTDETNARTTTVVYGQNYALITDANGQQTRLDYAAGDLALELPGWTASGIVQSSGTLAGSGAVRYAVATAGQTAQVSQNIDVAAGETLSLGLTLQATGASTSHEVGLWSAQSGWGALGASVARIVSGPGQLVQVSGGLWRVVGLSATEATRIELARTYDQTGTASAQIFIDKPGGYRAGAELLAADPTLLRNVNASAASQMDQNSWSVGNLTKLAAGTIDGNAAYRYTVQTATNTSTVSKRFSAKVGETYTYTVTLQAVGAYTGHSFGLDGDISGYGTAALSSARIVSGPGTLTRRGTGASFNVEGLSATAPTRIEITRTFDRAEGVEAKLLIDLSRNERAGAALIAAAPMITRWMPEAAASGLLTKITAPPATTGASQQITQFGYDAAGNLTSVIDPSAATAADPNTATTRFTYDGSGNLLTSTDRLGKVTTRTYDSRNNLRSESRLGVASDAETALTSWFVYDSANRLRYSVSPDGRVSQNIYNAQGQLIRAEVYAGGTFAPGANPTEADLAAWVSGLQDKAREVTQYEYDARGTLTRAVAFGSLDGNGTAVFDTAALETFYVYDQAGQLLFRRSGGQQQESFLYDGLGRLITSTDVKGGTTRFFFSDVARQTIVTLSGGLVQTSTYNQAGDLLSTMESGDYADTGTDSYQYDERGRMRIAVDATGRKSYVVYDNVGRRVGDVNQLGQLTEYRYDSRDRLVATVIWGTALSDAKLASLADPLADVQIASLRPGGTDEDLRSWTVYDREGRVLQRIDGTGAVVVNAYDAAGRLIKETGYYNRLASTYDFNTTPPGSVQLPVADPARDSITRTFYDRDGNITGRLDGEGYLALSRYDGAGNKTEERRFASPVGVDLRAAGTLNQLVAASGTSANDRITRYVYDGQGRLQFVISPLRAIVEYSYAGEAVGSATGSIRKRIAYAEPIPDRPSYTAASVRTLLDGGGMSGSPANRVSRSIYDNRGSLVYEVDAAGGVVSYLYDQAGNVSQKIQFYMRTDADVESGLAQMTAWAATAGHPENRVTRYFYSQRTNELRFTLDAEGYLTRWDYDAEGRKIAETRYDNRGPYLTYDTSQTITIADVSNWVEGSVTSTTSYDAAGRVALTKNGGGITTQFMYAVNGTLAYTQEAYDTAEEKMTLFEYDDAGRLISTIEDFDTAKSTTRYSYDGLGNRLTIAQSDGTSNSFFEYDRAGNVVKERDALGTSMIYEYNAFGEQIKITDKRGGVTLMYRDSLGRATTVRDAEGYVTETSYRNSGEVADVVRRWNRAANPASLSTLPQVSTHELDARSSFQYDKLGRLVSSFDAEHYSKKIDYTSFGEIRSEKNEANGLKTYLYDRLGRQVKEIAAGATQVTDGNISPTSYTKHIYTYDSRGNVVRDDLGDPSVEQSQSTYFTYDKSDRLIEKSLGFRLIGNPDSRQSSEIIEKYIYDRRGNIRSITDTNGGETFFYYNKLDQKIAEVSAIGTLTRYVYDKNGYIISKRIYVTAVNASLSSPPTGSGEYRQTTFTNDALGRVIASSMANVRVGSWVGDSYQTAVVTVIETQEYDSVGNLVRSIDGTGRSSYSYYDQLNRKVAQVDQEGYLTEWTLNAEGNVLSERRYAQPVSGASVQTRPAPVQHADDRVTDFTYDRNGRRLTETRRNVEAWIAQGAFRPDSQFYAELKDASGSSTITYTYNGLGQVTSKREATGETAYWGYDELGRMIIEVKEDLEFGDMDDDIYPRKTYHYDNFGQIVRIDQLGAGTTRYIYSSPGVLQKTIDATGAEREYFYDKKGNRIGERWDRHLSDGTIKTEGVSYEYDLADRLIYKKMIYATAGGWTDADEVTRVAYNAFGDVTSRWVNGQPQERFAYDSAGRLWRSTAGDGTWRYFVHDGAGRQTLAMESAGALNIQGKTLDEVLGLATSNGAHGVGAAPTGVVATISQYDGRGQAVAVIEAQRELGDGLRPHKIVNSRTYTAFGEVASETKSSDTTTYRYNHMGRLVETTYDDYVIFNENANNNLEIIKPVEKSYYDISGRRIGARDLNGARTLWFFAGGTGYDGTEGLLMGELRADGSDIAYRYDAAGNMTIRREQDGDATYMTYDEMGRLLSSRSNGGGPQHTYTYDELGRRLTHATAGRAVDDLETTDYDIAGRVVSTRAFGGDTTQVKYQWRSTASAGLGASGGWLETTTYQNGRTSTELTDTFGRTLSRKDMGGNTTTSAFDQAGRVASTTGAEVQTFSWFNTGLLASQTNTMGSGHVRSIASFAYDINGRRSREVFSQDGVTYRDAEASWDRFGRLRFWNDVDASGGGIGQSHMSIMYDAGGNIRSTSVVRPTLDASGNVTGSGTEQRYYLYDIMGRVTLEGGEIAAWNGEIVRGANGVSYTYRADGSRATATRTVMIDGPSGFYEGERRETYEYTSLDQLASVAMAETGSVVQNGHYVSSGLFTLAAGSGSYTYDAVGRLKSQTDKDRSGVVMYSRMTNYDARGLIQSDSTTTRQGTTDVSTTSTYNYDTGGYALGAVKQVVSTTRRGTQAAGTTTTTNSYGWREAAVLSRSSQSGAATSATTYNYDAGGRLSSVRIADGRARTVSFVNDFNGQAIRRDEADALASGDPHERWWRFGGLELGHVGNNTGQPADYAISIAQRGQAPSNQPFGTVDPRYDGDFTQALDPITSFDQGAPGGTHVVQPGDSLASIAAAVWGDASLWYKLAQANGLGGDAMLAPGQVLTIPVGVVRSTYNGATFSPFDPQQTLGDVSPVQPTPTAARKKNNKCGAFGQVLLVVVAVAVAVVTQGALVSALGPVLGGAAVGVAGSVASQGLGLATGIQDEFSFKGVALAAIAGGVGGALQGVDAFGKASGLAQLGSDAVRGAIGNALTQGVAVATGLQNRFDWAGVAVGGVAGAVGRGVGRQLQRAGVTGFGNGLAAGVAAGAAGAAARSLATGTSFGDNLLAVLPDVIGSTIGNMVAEGVQRTAAFNGQVSALEKAGISTDDAKSYVRQLGKLQRGDISGFLNQGGAGGTGVTAHTVAEERAYAAALAQTGSASDAQTAVLATALRERLDMDAGRVGASSLSAKVKDGFFRFKGAIDRALISTEVYFDRSIPEMLPSGYSRLNGDQVRGLGFDAGRLVDATSGYFSALYSAPGGNYIYANRGTDNGADWNSSIRQGLGEVSPQYKRAIDNARDLSQSLGNKLSFTGHSLGGGLATAQALVTGLRATVFDPAGVHPNTLARYGADFSQANKLVTSYYVQGEFLQGLNNQMGTPTRGQVVGLSAVEQLSRDQNDFRSTPTSDLNGFDGKARHATSALLSSMFYKYATTRAWP